MLQAWIQACIEDVCCFVRCLYDFVLGQMYIIYILFIPAFSNSYKWHNITLSVAVRVVTIYRYDDIPQYKHVRLSYCVHLLIYGIWRK